MFGCRQSVSTLLKQEIPHLLSVKCSCHSIHLVACYATRVLLDTIEAGLRAVYNHFSNSSARRRDFVAFQEFADCEKHIILAPGQTRWLSLEACVTRIVEQIVPLLLYFTLEQTENPKKQKIIDIYTFLHYITIMPYLEFLRHALHAFNEFNTVFQTEAPMLYDLKNRVYDLIRDFAMNFMAILEKPVLV